MSEQAAGDGEYTLLHPNAEAIAAFLEAEGIDVETAVVEYPSGDSPGSLSVKFWTGGTDRTPIEQEGQR